MTRYRRSSRRLSATGSNAPPSQRISRIAELPVTSGGLAGPNLHRQAVVARISCLATLPELVATQACRGGLIDRERPELFGRLSPLIGPTPMEVVGDIHNPPPRKSFARLSKKLTHFHYTSQLQ